MHYGLIERLKKIRQVQGWTRAGLSLDAGLANNTVAGIEVGQMPRVDTVETLAWSLGVEPCWLAFGTEGVEPFRKKTPGGAARPGTLPSAISTTAPNDAALHAGLPTRLTAARVARALTRQALGEAAMTTEQTVANIEEGCNLPAIATVERLAKALSVSPGWLAFGQGCGLDEAGG